MKKNSIDILALIFSTCLMTTTSFAQTPAAPTTDSGGTAQATQLQNNAQATPAQDQGTGEKPPAAVGEEGKKATGAEDTKPTRGSSLNRRSSLKD